ncbi:PRC-barrel domain-containing protein [Paraburkholderia sp. MMS20-SJTR3]|uniref:PRC-barrel domain-containing protein n=1 Tax=Paraburkholderia sejongensis TaxID=2886946 RepID=A0ABS8JRW9_9BURK|nr:PRC-barrel domain-containing protein [Paraburkholderia sp. MMS20-SJTR3]MCC8392473.1 PRC-barrel domain-containing protein [Paraburkholderia sp. MMS20-SJTR3]
MNQPDQPISESGAPSARTSSAPAYGPGPDVMAAATLAGRTVLSADGDDVGKIKDIMLDVRGGRIAYAVLASGGFLGIGGKLLAIPWPSLTLDTARDWFVLSASTEQVRQAPGFDKDHWPAMADPDWATHVHAYYHARPYWIRRAEAPLDERGDLRIGESVGDAPDSPERGDVKL